MLSKVASLVVIRLQVKQVEGLLAGAQDQRDGVAVPQGELQLHVDLLGRLARDPVGAKPVVLAVLHHVTDLEGPDGSVVLIHPTDLLPLKEIEREGGGGGKRRREMKKADASGMEGQILRRKNKRREPKDGGRREGEQLSGNQERRRQ